MNIVQAVATVERRIQQLDAPSSARTAAFRQALSARSVASGSSAKPALAPSALDPLIAANAARYGVDPALVRAVVTCESGGDPNATSATGAAGLMQLMPATAAALGVSDPYDGAQNVAGGTRYLRSLLDRFGGDTTRAIAAYNAGPGAVEHFGTVPPYAETQRYVADVLDTYVRLRD